MVEIVDSAMVKVKECPINGELYFSMLSAYYLNKFEYTEGNVGRIQHGEKYLL